MRIITNRRALRIPCESVKDRKEGGAIARRMADFLERQNKKGGQLGIGLAANQVGIQKQVCLLKACGRTHVLMNPQIVAYSEQRVPVREGCLSLPGVIADTWRYLWVRVSTLNAGEMTFGLSDKDSPGDSLLLATCAQHEIGHICGLLHTDFTKEDYPPPEEWAAWREHLDEEERKASYFGCQKRPFDGTKRTVDGPAVGLNALGSARRQGGF